MRRGRCPGKGHQLLWRQQQAQPQEQRIWQQVETGRKLIRTASMDVETEQFEQLMTALKTQIRQFGGYIENEMFLAIN